VTSIARAGGRWTVQAGEQTLHAPWLLGADGAGGLVRKQVSRAFERRQLSIAAGSYVDGVDTTEIVIAFVDNPRGYLWSFPRPGHLAAGTCAQADETSTAEMHRVTDRWLDGYAPAAGRPRRRYAWPIPSLDARDIDAEQPAGDGWMLLGDAAGLVDPITREGIFFALRSGMLAAAALGSASPAHTYGEGVRDELHDELRRAARFKAGFFRPRFTGLLVDALNQSAGIRDVMIDLVAGRQPYRGLKRRLIGTLELGLMVRALTWPGSRPARAR
jgi:flavin-dependent dehydrogenase